MPVSFQQIRTQIKQIGPEAVRRRQVLEERREKAEQLLNQHAGNLDELRQRVEQASATNPELRCAIPGNEPLTFVKDPPPLDMPVAILAADGSQINPDRHEQVEFGVINTGAVLQRPGAALEEHVDSLLLFGDALQLKSGAMTEEYVALLRDVSERTFLAGLAEKEALPVVTLTDGQLELFRQPQKTPEYEQKFDEYRQALRRLAAVQAVTAGYVDRPRADLVVRLLELMMYPEEQMEKAARDRPLRMVSDSYLYSNLLAPGQRSPVFQIQSRSSESFPEELALHFFYINVGDARRAYLARVETPAWVAAHPLLLNRLHAVLVEQARILPNRPYPYLLHRAHEVAVVHLEEKQQVGRMIAQEFLDLGLPPGEKTNKQLLKDGSADRKRFP